MSLENVKYDAFISYRHCELDSFISENLHKKLEAYKMPSSVAKNLAPDKTKIERVFRDEAELPLSGNLSDPITVALDNSEFLIVICTPRLRESQWCLKEIETFVSTHDRQHVLLVLAEGEPSESFPEILLHEEIAAKDADGNSITVTVDREPLAADCRADNNKDRLKKLDNVVLKLCAAMFGLNYDDLKQRHREREMKRRIVIASVAFSIVSLFAVTCLFFMLRISRQKEELADKYAGAMASASRSLLSEGLQKDALYTARSVLPDKPRKGYNSDAYMSLSSALAPYEFANTYYPAGELIIPQAIRGMDISADDPCFLVNADGYSVVIKTADSTRVRTIDSEYAVIDDDNVIYIDDDGQAVITGISDDSEEVLAENAVDIYSMKESGITLILCYDGFIGIKDGERVFESELPSWWSEDGEDVEASYIDDGGRYAAFILSTFDDLHCCVVDAKSGSVSVTDTMEKSDATAVATDGDTLWIYREYSSLYDGTAANIESIDLGSMEVISQRQLSGEGFYSILPLSDGVLVVSDRITYLLDEELSDINVLTGYNDAVCAFGYGEGAAILDASGTIYPINMFSTDRTGFYLYGHDRTTMIANASYDSGNDVFFIHYVNTARISVYERKAAAEPVAVPEDAELIEYPDSMPGISGFAGIEDNGIFEAEGSDDGKYTALSASDGALYIFDNKTHKMIKTVYSDDLVFMHTGFIYLDRADVYIIEGRVFDRDFNMIARLPRGEIVAKDSDGKSVYIESGFNPDDHYKISILPYEEMTKRADELLGDFVPEDDIRARYSIN